MTSLAETLKSSPPFEDGLRHSELCSRNYGIQLRDRIRVLESILKYRRHNASRDPELRHRSYLKKFGKWLVEQREKELDKKEDYDNYVYKVRRYENPIVTRTMAYASMRYVSEQELRNAKFAWSRDSEWRHEYNYSKHLGFKVLNVINIYSDTPAFWIIKPGYYRVFPRSHDYMSFHSCHGGGLPSHSRSRYVRAYDLYRTQDHRELWDQLNDLKRKEVARIAETHRAAMAEKFGGNASVHATIEFDDERGMYYVKDPYSPAELERMEERRSQKRAVINKQTISFFRAMQVGSLVK